MILVFGSINIDLVAKVAAIPAPGETVLSDGYEKAFGGKGANQAVAAARAGAGLPVRMAGAVGDDGFGREAVANLAAQIVDTGGVEVVGLPTGCAFITVDARGENAITVGSGANRKVSADAVSDALLAETKVLVLQMEVPGRENLAIARRAKAAGATVVLNIAPVAADLPAVLAAELLAVTDVLIANEHEALALEASLALPTSANERAAIAGLARRYALTGIVTLGSKGVLAVEADGRETAVPALPIVPVDTTGAGDTFVGILAVGLARALPLQTALQRAAIGASLACLGFGAQAAMPDAAAIDARIASQVVSG